MAGWICLHRTLLDWEWYDDANTTRLFIHCLLRANHSDTKWRGIEILRGSFWTSLDTLKKETGLTASKLRTSISKLEKTGELASKSQAGGRMISISNYESYQGFDKPDSKEIAKESQSNDKAVTTNNNDNNENPVKNENKVNKKEVAKAPKFNFKQACLDLGVEQQVLEDWLVTRKKKRSSNTQTSLTMVVNQAEIAGIHPAEAIKVAAENNWSSFKAEWYQNSAVSTGSVGRQTLLERNQQAARDFVNEQF